MSANTSVDVQGMVLAQQDFQNALAQVNTAYNGMSDEQASLASNWTGEAASAFGQALNQYLEDLKSVQTELANMEQTLGTHTGIYNNTNATSTQMAGSFKAGLPGL